MRPLIASGLNSFLQRFDNFRGGEIRSIEIISATIITITLVGQDSARAFDWVSVTLEFSSVIDAKVIENSKLSFIDMQSGISIINTGTLFAFAIDECSTISNIKSSACFVVCSDLKYKEGAF